MPQRWHKRVKLLEVPATVLQLALLFGHVCGIRIASTSSLRGGCNTAFVSPAVGLHYFVGQRQSVHTVDNISRGVSGEGDGAMHATLRLNSHRGRTSSRWQEYRSIRGAGDGGVGLRRRGRRRDRAGGGRVGATVRMATDLYEVLEIPDTAEQSEIKRAYRRKALKTHPDVNNSPNAKAEFSEVVNAYEVLSDEKRKKGYDTKRKFTSPFGRGNTGTTGAGRRAGAGAGGGGASSWGRSTYDAAREEASRRWREKNPLPDQIDDSFGDIFRDFFGGVAAASGGGGVLNDVVDFLENRVDSFSSDTSVEFEDLMSSNNFDEMKAELDNTRLLLEELQKRSRKLNTERIASENEVAAMKATKKRLTDISELDRQMAIVEKAAGIKARYEEMQGHVKRAKSRLGRLERKITYSRDVGQRPGGGNYSNSGSSGSYNRSNYSSRPSSSSTYSSSRGTASSGNSSGSGSSSTGRQQRPGSSAGSSGNGRNTRGSDGSSKKTPPPPPSSPPPRRGVPGGRRRADDPDVEAELARMKREMGL